MLACGWLLTVCFFWEAFPISAAVYGPLFRTLGGSTPVMASLVYSMIAKHVPEANRSVLTPILCVEIQNRLTLVADLSVFSTWELYSY